MPRKLTFEDFRFTPSEAEQQKHRVAIRELRNKRIISAPTEKDRAFVEALRKQLPKGEPSRPRVLPKHDLAKWLERIPAPNPPRLRKHIFGLGSVYAVSIPEAEFPWTAWFDCTLETGAEIEGNSGTNGAFVPPSNTSNDTIKLGATAGYGGPEWGSTGAGGQATGFAYQGQYFTASAVSESGVPLVPNGVFLTVSANPSINSSWNWSTYLGANAAVSLSVGFLIQIFPPNAPMQTLWGPQSVIYQKNQWTGGDESQSPGPQFWPIDFSFPVEPGYSYGVFVQYIASAQGDGESPGSWVPGSYGVCGLTSTLAAIQYRAICSLPA
jgi:hypothetical protein